MSRKLKILVIVVAIAAVLGIIGGTVYAATGGDTGLSSLWHSACGQGFGDRACGQGNGGGCCGGGGEQLQNGSCH